MRPEPVAPGTAVEAAFAAAAIPAQRQGRARTAKLDEGERTLYRWMLRRFADDRRGVRQPLGGPSKRESSINGSIPTARSTGSKSA